ncbi:16S rRNA (cytosine(1402)-N(4))-methyltransferase RsmH, partial [bacterium]|nr:16S rRNA (cytosine(1402)-N(4))-methyltransferase RsmH [bacterium]
GLNLKSNYNVIDATLGGGGHAQKILDKIKPQGKLIGVDLDEKALNIAKENLLKDKNQAQNIILIKENYKNINQELLTKQITKTNESLSNIPINAILLDLGLSLYQLQEKGRGFSFYGQDSLDMSFSEGDSESVNDILENYSAENLANIFYKFGEEKLSRQIASLIVKRRAQEKIDTPRKLVKIIELIYKTKFNNKSKINPSTKVFQALRIYVNKELENIEIFLPKAIDLLEKKGRLVVVTYHSLEDRIVKKYFQKEAKDCLCPPELPICKCGHSAQIKIINRKVITPSAEEIKNNPAARSAKLRIVEKI